LAKSVDEAAPTKALNEASAFHQMYLLQLQFHPTTE